MELFGRELSLEQMIGLVECQATPDEDLVHRAALEIIAALRESQRREREKGCDFCLDPDGDNCDNGLYIDHTNRPAITTHDIYVPIDYCPMCGRHLTKEEV